MGKRFSIQPETLFGHPATGKVVAHSTDALRQGQGLQLLAAMPPLSITSVKTYGKTGIGCLVFQHKREDIPGTAAVIFDHQVLQAPLAHLAMTKAALERFGNAG